jgi:hypothetical protein
MPKMPKKRNGSASADSRDVRDRDLLATKTPARALPALAKPHRNEVLEDKPKPHFNVAPLHEYAH